MANPWIGRTIGNYIVRSQIGQGGMGVVLAGVHRFLDEPVAIKVLRAVFCDDETLSARFFREATATRAIDHPNIVKILDFGVDQANSELYLVMELLEGESLASALKDGQALDEQRAAQIAMEVADGLGAAHALNIVHRDLKPGNVFLCKDGRVKVVDFGVAKAQDAAQTATGVLLGTPKFMAPEQARKTKNIGPAADIYSLGVLMFRMVTGVVPFDGEMLSVIAQHAFAEPPLPSSLGRVSPEMDSLILDCLAKDPVLRPESMAAVRARLVPIANEAMPAAMYDTYGDHTAAPLVMESLVHAPFAPSASAMEAVTKQKAPAYISASSEFSGDTTREPIEAYQRFAPTKSIEAPPVDGSSDPSSVGEIVATPIIDHPRELLTRTHRLILVAAVIIGATAGIAGGLILRRRATHHGDAPAVVAPATKALPSIQGHPSTPPPMLPPKIAPPVAAPPGSTMRDEQAPSDPAALAHKTPNERSNSARVSARALPPARAANGKPPVDDRIVRMPLLVHILSVPSGAKVLIDDSSAGVTPMALSLSLPRAVDLTLAGHKTAHAIIRAAGDTTIKLEADAAPPSKTLPPNL